MILPIRQHFSKESNIISCIILYVIMLKNSIKYWSKKNEHQRISSVEFLSSATKRNPTFCVDPWGRNTLWNKFYHNQMSFYWTEIVIWIFEHYHQTKVDFESFNHVWTVCGNFFSLSRHIYFCTSILDESIFDRRYFCTRMMMMRSSSLF